MKPAAVALLAALSLPAGVAGAAGAAVPPRCGIVVPQEDFSKSDRHGDLTPLALRVCAGLTRLTPETFPDTAHGVTALRRGRIDLLVGVSPDPTTEAALGLVEGPILLDDGQGFLVRRDGPARVSALSDRVICFIAGTPMEQVLDDAMAARHIRYRPHPFEESGEMQAALVGGSCDAITADRSALDAMRAGFHSRVGDFLVLPETIGADPYVALRRANEKRPAVRAGGALVR